ncbi:metallophosphoesterase family protein [Neobacillus muris]|uniref:metallophosphoesterase family protein n=1 Tax=Neobacillus muris TaxID=2941334 RepID=UPI00204069C6|nr:DNA repair exonuclease [Neobacillus muris]
MGNISFIHAADLHLDSPMVGLKYLPAEILARVKESTFTAFKKVTAAAIEREVDFVIIAGDLFDGEDRSLRAQSRFRAEMLKLEEKGIPVFIVHGNHDHLKGSWVHMEMPRNVHIFDTEVECKTITAKTGEIVHLYGFSYGTRHVFDRKIDDYQKVAGADFHIGILHGNERTRTDHDNYAPFSIRDLQEKEFDYWALGHIHKRAVLSESPPVVYPGNIQGRNKKETGRKGFYHVSLTNYGSEMDFIEASDIVWEEASIDVSAAVSFHEIYQLCLQAINQFRRDGIGTLLSLTLNNVHLTDELEAKSLDRDLLELLLEDEKDDQSFVWLVNLTILTGKQADRGQLKLEANFYSELFDIIDHYQVQDQDQALAPLYEHSLGRKYLTGLTEQEKRELVERAEKLLIDLLYHE